MTRVLVRSHRMRDGIPTGCTGATMEDGTVYRANRRGHMEVEDQGHVAAMLAHSDGEIVLDSGIAHKAPGVSCESCGFTGFKFHLANPCPRCGGRMADETKPKEQEQ